MTDCEGCEFPTITKMAQNLTLTLANALVHAAKTGEVRASRLKADARLKACNACEFKKDNRCLDCGCVLTLKIGLDAATCEKGKWDHGK